MKLRIFTKLFLVLLLSLLIPLGAMMASVHWSFRHGLRNYLHQVELERLETLSTMLADIYAADGNWDKLRGNWDLWRNLLREGLRPSPGAKPLDWEPRLVPEHREWAGDPPRFGGPPPWEEPPMSSEDTHRRGPPPPPGVRFLARRLRLLDADRTIVMASETYASPQDEQSLVPIRVSDRTVGWLAVRRSDFISDRLALAFVGQQSQANYLILGLALLGSVTAAWVLARQILRPLRRIADGTKSLASGHYDVDIPASGDELGDLARDFNRLGQTLKRNEQARRQWIAEISHELRTPLAVLRGEIDALHDGIRQPTPERLASLHAEAAALSKLVDDLYELSLSDLGALSYKFESLDLGEVLGQVAETFRPRFEQSDLRLDLTVVGPVRLNGDARRLVQLFSNLLENSFRYTEKGGRCEVRVEAATDSIIARVDDSQPGVPEAAMGQLFERLYRVEGSRSRQHGGAGLGLAICRNIVEAHGGSISARPSPLGGLQVRVEFPRRGQHG